MPLTARALVAEFLAHQTKLVAAGEARPATLTYYQTQLKKLTPLLPAKLGASQVKPIHLLRGPRAWHFHQAARRAFTWGHKVGLLKVDPLVGHQMPRLGQRERVPTDQERERIYYSATDHFRPFLLVLWGTGARPGELRELTWAQVNLAEASAEVRDYKAKRRRKDAPPVRVLYFDAGTAELLGKLQAQVRPAPADHVFTNRSGLPLTKDAVCLAFRRACERAGVNQAGERLVPYSYRHGRATELTADGVSTRLLAEFLGHKQERTTGRYQHPRRADVHRAIAEAAKKKAG